MRGQYLSIEYVLFFAFGVAMAVMVFMAFWGIGNTVRDTAAAGQLGRTAEVIRTTMVDVFGAANATGSTIYYNLTIPPKLSGCTYAIIADSGRLSLNCTDNYKIGVVLSLYGIPASSGGVLYSGKGMLEIDATPASVTLR